MSAVPRLSRAVQQPPRRSPFELTPERTAALAAAFSITVAAGETHAQAFARGERAIGALFVELTVAEAYGLHKRLVANHPADPLAVAFCRLIAERRARLLAVLADARRRAAVTHGR